MNKATAHECGHLLGLVHEHDSLGGNGEGHNWGILSIRRYMNPGSEAKTADFLRRTGVWSWKANNAEYLKFILPKSE